MVASCWSATTCRTAAHTGPASLTPPPSIHRRTRQVSSQEIPGGPEPGGNRWATSRLSVEVELPDPGAASHDPGVGFRRAGYRFRSAHVKSRCMCAERRFGRARPRLRMSLSGFRLHHGPRGSCAAREPEAVAGATHLFRCLLWHLRRLGCALHPILRGGSLRASNPMREGHRSAATDAVPEARRLSAAANAIGARLRLGAVGGTSRRRSRHRLSY